MRLRDRLELPSITGNGLVLRPWDQELVRQLARWGLHPFPYHPFNLPHLRDRQRAAAELHLRRARSQHRHFIACEGSTAVGRVSVNMEDPAGLYIWSVHVPPEHEGRGVCRRMLATLIDWLERSQPGRDFVLTSNAFALHAHRAYTALGFAVESTRWQYDRELADGLWHANAAERQSIAHHTRFCNGRWEVRAHVFRRPVAVPMYLD